MKLLEEIVDYLSDESKSLTTAFLKVKVVTSRLGAQEIASWVTARSNRAATPSIRAVKSFVAPAKMSTDIHPLRRHTRYFDW